MEKKGERECASGEDGKRGRKVEFLSQQEEGSKRKFGATLRGRKNGMLVERRKERATRSL